MQCLTRPIECLPCPVFSRLVPSYLIILLVLLTVVLTGKGYVSLFENDRLTFMQAGGLGLIRVDKVKAL